MIPVKIGELTIRHQLQDLKVNEECLKTELDLLEELRDKARIREKAVQRNAIRRYNSKVVPKAFNKNDLVWRIRTTAQNDATYGKFASNWEGPF